jgi:hypothetical protein
VILVVVGNTLHLCCLLAEHGPEEDQTSSNSGSEAHRAGAHRSSAHSVKQELGAILDRLGVRNDAGRSTRDGLLTIDFALQPSEDRFVAMQVGLWPCRHAQHAQVLDAVTLRRCRCL